MKLWRYVGIALLLFVVFSCFTTGSLPGPVLFVGALIYGWALYLSHVIPKVVINWSGVLSGAISLIAVLIVGHWIARWLWRETRPVEAGKSRWKPAWTVAFTCIVILLFLSGMAAVGIAHQSAWLARSDKPMFTYFRDATARVRCAANMKQIGLAIELYARENAGRYPDNLEQLLETQDITPEVMICPATDLDKSPGNTPQEQAKHLHEGHVSYFYVGKGLSAKSASATWPILFEQPENHDSKGVNILFGDFHAEFFGLEEARRILKDFIE